MKILVSALLIVPLLACTSSSTSGSGYPDYYASSTSTSGFCCDEGSSGRFGGSGGPPQPVFGDVVTQSAPPRPVAGGTLVALKSDGDIAVASDPDADVVHVVNLRERTVQTVILQPGDEPGRIIEDGAGAVLVVLRGAAQVMKLDVLTLGTVRRDVCAQPRGIARNPANGMLHVACRGGELWSFPSIGPDAPQVLMLPDDLRDVVVDGPRILVSRFRSAEILVVEDGVLARTLRLPGVVAGRMAPAPDGTQAMMQPAVAWRMVPREGGGAFVSHQRALHGVINAEGSGTYGSFPGMECFHGGLVESVVTVIASGARVAPGPGTVFPGAVLPVDLAAGTLAAPAFVLVAPGNALTPGQPTVFTLQNSTPQDTQDDQCAQAINDASGAAPVATDISPNHGVVVQTRDPAGIWFNDARETIPLPTQTATADTGHQIFHANAGAGVACASCHPEGDDDGRVWTFEVEGPRRTPGLRFGLAGTEPFHWAGDLNSLETLMADVFVRRMSGPQLNPGQTNALMHWLDALPRPVARTADADAVARGRALFEREDVACAACHSGSKFTNNQTVNVGTGGNFQVPSLIGLGWRAPFMHDGCAATLLQRFDPACGGGEAHGRTAHLGAGELVDLSEYLQSL